MSAENFRKNVLKSILIEFYSAEEVSVARRLLLKYVEMAKDVSAVYV